MTFLLYLVQRVALVIVPLRQTVDRIGADEGATGVGVTHRVDVWGGRGVRWSWKRKRQKQAKTKKKSYKNRVFSFPDMLLAASLSPLTGSRDDSKNIFVQAGVQEGAGAGRRHQSVGEETIFSSILKNRETQHCHWNLGIKYGLRVCISHRHTQTCVYSFSF